MNKDLSELIDYALGCCDPNERASVEQRLGASQDDRETVSEFSELVTDIRQYFSSQRTIEMPEEMRHRIESRIEAASRYGGIRNCEFLKNLPTPVYRTSPEGHILMANDAMARLLGYERVEDLERVRSTTFYVVDADREEWRHRVETEGILKNFEVVWQRRDGRKIFVRNHARAVYDGDGRVLFYEGTVEDITELRQGEAAYASLFSQLPVGAVQLDTNGRISNVNKRALEILAYEDPKELLGRAFWHFLRKRDRDKCRTLIEARLRGDAEPTQLLYRNLCAADRRVVPVEVLAQVLKDGENITGILCTIQSLSVRDDVMHNLTLSEEGVNSLFENLPLPVFRKDLKHRFTYGNFCFRAELGVSSEMLVGKTDFDFYPPNLASRYQADDKRVFEGQCLDTIERHKPPKGDGLWVQVLKHPIFAPNGEITGVQGIYWAVPLRKAVLDTLRSVRQESDQTYDSLSSLAGNGIYRCTPQGRMQYANPALARMFGFASVDELIKGANETPDEFFVQPEQRLEILASVNAPPWEIHNVRYRAYQRFSSGNRRIVHLADHIRAVRGVRNQVLYLEGFTRQDNTAPPEDASVLSGTELYGTGNPS